MQAIKDRTKTKAQLITELAELRRRVATLEAAQSKPALSLDSLTQGRYEFIVNTSRDFMTLIGPDYTYEAVNEVYCQAHNKTREQIIGQTMADVWGHERYSNQIKELLDQCFAGKEVNYQGWFEFATLGRRYFTVAFYPYYHQNETTVSHAVVISRDVTERKLAEEALLTSEERFRQVITSISDHIYVTEVKEDGSHVNLYLSPHAQILTGYPLQKFAENWHFWASKVIHPDDRAAAAIQAEELAQGKNSDVEYRLVRADGQVIWVRDSARVHYEGRSKIIYGVVGDITDRKQAEAEIQKLNQSLEKRVADRTRELSALYDVSLVASDPLELDIALERSLQRVLVAMRSEMGAIHLLHKKDKTLHLATQEGIPPDIADKIGLTSSENGLVNRVIEHGEALVISDTTSDLRVARSIQTDNFRTYVGVPMRARGQALGVLSVFGQAKQQFNMEEVALLASIADQVGVMIENAWLRQQAKQTAVMEERARLARELHDSVTQLLYSLTLFSEVGRESRRNGDLEQVDNCLAEVGDIAQQALKEMRLLVYELQPAALEHEGLVGVLQHRLDAVEGRTGVKARLLVDEVIELAPAIEKELFYIAHEALNNALKHAGATLVTVHITGGEWMTLEVIDDGKGFYPEAMSNAGGLGLISMRERAEKLGGSLVIQSAPNKGTTIKVSLKLK